MEALATDVPLPLDKLSLEIINQVRGKLLVFVSTGSFNSPTFMHLRCFELARDALNSQGFCVIGGYMSPVNDSYKKKGLICADHRIAMCGLTCRSSDFVMVDSWEARQSSYQGTLTVLTRIRDSLCMSRLVSGELLKVMLVCSSDLLESFSIPGFWIREQVKTICRDFGLVCIRRGGQNVENIISNDDILKDYKVLYFTATNYILPWFFTFFVNNENGLPVMRNFGTSLDSYLNYIISKLLMK